MSQKNNGRVRVRVCVRVCVLACVRACVRAVYLYACMRIDIVKYLLFI